MRFDRSVRDLFDPFSRLQVPDSNDFIHPPVASSLPSVLMARLSTDPNMTIQTSQFSQVEAFRMITSPG